MSRLGLEYDHILGINVNSSSEREVLRVVGDLISHSRKFCLFSANPELLVMTTGDPELKKTINQAEIVIPDGFGLKLAKADLPILKGRKFFLKLFALAKEKHWRTFLLGGQNLPQVIPGPRLNRRGEPVSPTEAEKEKKIMRMINQVKPDLLFVGFGMPKQEYWLARNLPKLDIKGAMTVGGTFDYVFGKAKLPPVWLENLGLEWLWRLVRDPKRFGRIFNATIKFPLLFFRDLVAKFIK